MHKHVGCIQHPWETSTMKGTRISKPSKELSIPKGVWGEQGTKTVHATCPWRTTVSRDVETSQCITEMGQ